MKRIATVVVLVLLVALPLAALLPGFVPAVVRAHGVAVESAHWCRQGLCLGPATAGRIRAADATLAWDGVLTLTDVHVAAEAGVAGAVARAEPSADASAGELPEVPFVRAVRVEGLVLDGTPLPSLSGEVLPERHLRGEGARVDGDEAELTLPTAYGELRVVVTPGERGGHHLVAECTCTLTTADLGGTLADIPVRAEGELSGRSFRGHASVGAVHAEVEADVGGPTRVTGHFTLPETPIADAYAVVEALVPEVRRADIRGTLAAKGRFTLEPFSLHVEPTLTDFAVDGLVRESYRGGGTYTWIGHDAQGGEVTRTSGDADPDWRALPGLGEYLPMAVIAAEDARFFAHPGYDVEGMLAAQDDNAKAGGVVRGGSTLSQQLAKNLFLRGDRTYARKLQELLYAVEMERELGKPRILELYLNIVEWGPDLFGARQASEAYFLKEPQGLLPEEAAFLASILRNPRGGWAKEYAGGRVNGRRLAWILDNMVGLDPQLRAEALGRDVHFVPPAVADR